jgi:soluble cytochrome b562
MKKRLLLLTALCTLAVGPAVNAQDKDAPETELGGKMEKVSSAWRVAKRGLADPAKNADTLVKLAAMKENLVAALKFEPDFKKEKPAAEQAKFVADYQAKMKDMIALVDKVTALVKEGKNEEAAKMAGVIDKDYKDAHGQFKKPSKKKQ